MRAMRVCATWTVAGVALFGAMPSAGAQTAAQTPADHVYAFAQPWACRNVEGVVVRQTAVRDGESLVVSDDVDRRGKHERYEDRYTFDPALNRWHVTSGLGGFSASASPWLGATWAVQSENAAHVGVRMTAELLPGGDFRRTFAFDNGGHGWFPYSVERCTPGTTPPGPDACIAERYPATTLETAPVKRSQIPPSARSGVVEVVVSLDENSQITGVRILRSASTELNASALAATRASRFRTDIVNCKPVAADYIFTVTF
jgi:TonB-like protein